MSRRLLQIKSRLLTWLQDIRYSYWFIPAAMVLAALLASSLTVAIDRHFTTLQIPFLFEGQPEGARAVLSTIAGSMITVAGVTFSITIASVAYAASQFGPRILTRFMQDTGNRITLGTFLASFVYCLMVLRVVTNGDEGVLFVPRFSLLVGVALAVAGIGVLIYFVHHVPQAIHVSNVVSAAGAELQESLESLFPSEVGHEPDDPDDRGRELPDDFDDVATIIRASRAGYIERIDGGGLLRLLTEENGVALIHCQPGDFIRPGQPLISAMVADPERATDLQSAFAIGPERTQSQDALLFVDELVEIAGRALSPGTNDPFTAMACLDWLTVGLSRLGRGHFPSSRRFDDKGVMRLVTRERSFSEFLAASFDQLRPYVAADRNAAMHAMKALQAIAHASDERHAEDIRAQARALLEAADTSLPHTRDRELLSDAFQHVAWSLDGREQPPVELLHARA